MFIPLFGRSTPSSLFHPFEYAFGGLRPSLFAERSESGPAFDVFDDGDQFRLVAEVPGLRVEDLEVEARDTGLVVRGRRRVEAPEGFTARRRERQPLELSRSFTFPTKIDPERVTADLEHGLLTITLAKEASGQPRSIPVRSIAA